MSNFLRNCAVFVFVAIAGALIPLSILGTAALFDTFHYRPRCEAYAAARNLMFVKLSYRPRSFVPSSCVFRQTDALGEPVVVDLYSVLGAPGSSAALWLEGPVLAVTALLSVVLCGFMGFKFFARKQR